MLTPRFSCRVVAAFLFLASATASASVDDLMSMADQLDALDHQDFNALIEKADNCIRSRNFGCAEGQLANAKKLANTPKDKSALKLASNNLAAERRRAAEEERLAREEEDRRLRLAEEELRRAERAAQEADAEAQEPSKASQAALFGSLLLKSYAQQSSARAAENAQAQQRWNTMQSEVRSNLAQQQQRFAEERSRIEAARLARQQQANRQSSQSTSTPQADRPRAAQSEQPAAPQALGQAVLPAQTSQTPESANSGSSSAPATGYSFTPEVVDDRYRQTQLTKEQTEGWCEKSVKYLQTMKWSPHILIGINVSQCACRLTGGAVANETRFLQKEYDCDVPYTWKKMAPDGAR